MLANEKRRYVITSDFRQYIAEYKVANFWRYPIRRRVTYASALECRFVCRKANKENVTGNATVTKHSLPEAPKREEEQICSSSLFGASGRQCFVTTQTPHMKSQTQKTKKNCNKGTASEWSVGNLGVGGAGLVGAEMLKLVLLARNLALNFDAVPNYTSRKHACIMLTPLNPTFI